MARAPQLNPERLPVGTRACPEPLAEMMPHRRQCAEAAGGGDVVKRCGKFLFQEIAGVAKPLFRAAIRPH